MCCSLSLRRMCVSNIYLIFSCSNCVDYIKSKCKSQEKNQPLKSRADYRQSKPAIHYFINVRLKPRVLHHRDSYQLTSSY